jgi:hypothetical protein
MTDTMCCLPEARKYWTCVAAQAPSKCLLQGADCDKGSAGVRTMPWFVFLSPLCLLHEANQF